MCQHRRHAAALSQCRSATTPTQCIRQTTAGMHSKSVHDRNRIKAPVSASLLGASSQVDCAVSLGASRCSKLSPQQTKMSPLCVLQCSPFSLAKLRHPASHKCIEKFWGIGLQKGFGADCGSLLACAGLSKDLWWCQCSLTPVIFCILMGKVHAFK